MFPKANEMPSLSGLDPLWPGLMTAVIAFDGLNLSEREKLYARLLARLTNKAITEYESARTAVDFMVDEHQGSSFRHIFEFIDRIENCVNAASRLFGVLEMASREAGRLAAAARATGLVGPSNQIGALRNAIEHIEGRIRSSGHGPVNIWFTEDGRGVELKDGKVSFEDLSATLTQFHAISLDWLDEFCRKST